jgi:hypothetical protein
METSDFTTVGQRLTGADRRELILELIEGS